MFFGDDEIPVLATRMLAEAPAGIPPMTLVAEGLRTLAAERFEPQREEMRAARRVIEAEPALRERDLRKQADLHAAVEAGIVARGEDPLVAETVAGITVTWIQTALRSWLADPTDRPLTEHLDAALDRMRVALRP